LFLLNVSKQIYLGATKFGGHKQNWWELPPNAPRGYGPDWKAKNFDTKTYSPLMFIKHVSQRNLSLKKK